MLLNAGKKCVMQSFSFWQNSPVFLVYWKPLTVVMLAIYFLQEYAIILTSWQHFSCILFHLTQSTLDFICNQQLKDFYVLYFTINIGFLMYFILLSTLDFSCTLFYYQHWISHVLYFTIYIGFLMHFISLSTLDFILISLSTLDSLCTLLHLTQSTI